MVSDNFFYLSCIILYLGGIIQSKLDFLNSTWVLYAALYGNGTIITVQTLGYSISKFTVNFDLTWYMSRSHNIVLRDRGSSIDLFSKLRLFIEYTEIYADSLWNWKK